MPFDNTERKPSGLGHALVGAAAGAAGTYYLLNRGKKANAAVKKRPKAVTRPQEGRKAVRSQAPEAAPKDMPVKRKAPEVAPKEAPVESPKKGVYGKVYNDFPQSNDPKFEDQSKDAMTRRRRVIQQLLDTSQAYDQAAEGSREKTFLGNKLNNALKGISDLYTRPGSVWRIRDEEE